MTREELAREIAGQARLYRQHGRSSEEIADAVFAVLEAAGIPITDILEGRSVVVPVEPTHAMYEVLRDQKHSYVHAKKDCWQALLAAAKETP